MPFEEKEWPASVVGRKNWKTDFLMESHTWVEVLDQYWRNTRQAVASEQAWLAAVVEVDFALAVIDDLRRNLKYCKRYWFEDKLHPWCIPDDESLEEFLWGSLGFVNVGDGPAACIVGWDGGAESKYIPGYICGWKEVMIEQLSNTEEGQLTLGSPDTIAGGMIIGWSVPISFMLVSVSSRLASISSCKTCYFDWGKRAAKLTGLIIE